MTASLAPALVFRGFDNNGNPLANGLLNTYAAGTTTPQATYVDSTQVNQNANPVVLNARGECNLWLNPSLFYKFVLTDQFGNPIYSVDQVPGSSGALSGSIPANGIFLPATNTLGFATNGTNWTTLGPSGSWIMNSNLAGANTLLVIGATGAPALSVGGSTVPGSGGIAVNAGNNTSDFALSVNNSTATAQFFQVRGDGDVLATDQGGNLHDVGWRDAPQRQISSSSSLALSDRGGSILFGANSIALNIPANSSVPFPTGTMVSLYTGSATGCTITITTDSLVWLPSAGSGTRNLAAFGAATLYKASAGIWWIYGIGLS